MRDACKFALCTAGAGRVVWLARGFVVLDWNVWAWTQYGRMALVGGAVIGGCIGMAAAA